jgi:hypothetical protein
MTKFSDFDLDYSYGVAGELLVNDLLTGGKTVEVKRDRRWKDTGNLFIETSYWSIAAQDWVLGGLNVTKAEYWAFVLEELVVIIPVEKLKEAVREYGRPIANNKQPNPSKGFLLRVEDLLRLWLVLRT